MSAKNAKKVDVYKKLGESINYCDSHHMPAQTLFDKLVDLIFSKENDVINPEMRINEMKGVYPVLRETSMSGQIPSLSMKEDTLRLKSEEFLRQWFSKWISKYANAWKAYPSNRVAKPKAAVTDRALIYMVMSFVPDEEERSALEWSRHHNLYMSAENIGGSLLEEYIARKIIPLGWIWCRGEILTAIDFCSHDCKVMFQVKNKTNTENSSGKGFREERGAKVWQRMKSEKVHNEIVTYWPDLVAIIQEGTEPGIDVPDDLMTEEGYLAFIKEVSRNNPQLITEKEE